MGNEFARSCCRFVATVALLASSGCASTQLNYNAVEVSATIDSVYTRETLNNLSKFIDNRNAIPSQVIMVGGTIQTVNTVNPSLTFPLTSQLARTVQAAPAGLTLISANTLSGSGAGVTATNSAQQNYTIAPLNDANTLRNQRALYQHAVYGTALIGRYHVPLVFFQDKFYPDPYHLQEPHCVLCAVQQGEFSGKQHPTLRENRALPGKWLYWDNDPRLDGLRATGEPPVDLGHYGNHELFMSRADYERGVLTDFVVFTLPNTELAETLTPVVQLTPGTPGAPSKSTGTAGPTSFRIAPAARQGPALIQPQGILPAQ
ncbi:hypothetical protein H8B02_06455 [Bradyrhizobium sp. Pear77]|uniref:hypothetical protein n=1 Tax=Bradyrhizobium altum TaxID=1571202 RepID=UPI001E41F17C|nr:hypothetical protein [Bradyrhizobium altum]MCC8953120.1 hypothetical protein [Bradyrhizobium altum]